MAHIVIFTDAEEGHILSTVGLAKHLSRCGHVLSYFSFPAGRALIERHGFQFVPVLERHLPDGETSVDRLHPSTLFYPLIEGALETQVTRTAPTVFITLTVMNVEALLLRYRYGTPVVLLRPHAMFAPRLSVFKRLVAPRLMLLGPSGKQLLHLLLSRTGAFRGKDIFSLFLDMPELVLFPKEFVTASESETALYYLSPAIDLERPEPSFEPGRIDPTRPLIYCALGSQARLVEGISRRFFTVVLEAIRMRPEYQLVLATGRGLSRPVIAKSANAHVLEWAPQISILKRANVMITHAGPGSVGEAIAAGVPMLFAPLIRDQLDCADQAVRHGLGLRVDLNNITPFELASSLDVLVGDPRFRERAMAMRECFVRSEWPLAASVIEQVAKEGKRSWRTD